MPSGGVHFALGEDDDWNLPKKYGERWAVRRKLTFASDSQLPAKVAWKSAYYIGQRYNGLFFLSSLAGEMFGDTHSYCSELIARIYQDLDEAFPTESSEKIFPSHLDFWTDPRDMEWADVTEEYKQGLSGDPIVVQAFDLRRTFLESAKLLAESSVAIFNAADASKQFREFTDAVFSEPVSTEEAEKLAKHIDFDLRSIKGNYSAIVDLAYVISELEASTEEERPGHLHWVQKIAQDKSGWSVEELRTTTNQNLDAYDQIIHQVLDGLISLSETLVLCSASKTHKSGLPENFSENSRRLISGVEKLLAILENFDGYVDDLAELNRSIEERLKTEPIHDQSARDILRRVVTQIGKRAAISSGPLRTAFGSVEASPLDHGALMTLYREACALK